MSLAHPLEKNTLLDEADKSPSFQSGDGEKQIQTCSKKEKTTSQTVTKPTEGVGDVRLLFLVLVFLGLLRTCLLSL